jgi:hypothetical protein
MGKETETKRPPMDITKVIWKSGKQEMEKLIKYLKDIGFCQISLKFVTVGPVRSEKVVVFSRPTIQTIN